MHTYLSAALSHLSTGGPNSRLAQQIGFYTTPTELAWVLVVFIILVLLSLLGLAVRRGS